MPRFSGLRKIRHYARGAEAKSYRYWVLPADFIHDQTKNGPSEPVAWVAIAVGTHASPCGSAKTTTRGASTTLVLEHLRCLISVCQYAIDQLNPMHDRLRRATLEV